MIHIIHGIHHSEGGTSTPARLIPELQERGLYYTVHDYGWALALTSRYQNPRRARKIAKSIMPGDCIIAHSNGCAITSIMLDMGIAPACVVFLQPALNKGTIFPHGNFIINVFHNKYDITTRILAKYLLCFHHPFGSMGAHGYKGNDPRIENYDVYEMFGEKGHVDPYFSDDVRQCVVESMTTNSPGGCVHGTQVKRHTEDVSD